MAGMANRNFISGYTAAVNALLDARATLKAYREQDSAVGIVAALEADDFDGTHASLDREKFLAAFTALDRVEGLLTDYSKQPPTPTDTLRALLAFRV